MSEIAPTSLLHPLKATVLDFQEDEHDYQFKVEYPEPTCCHACGAVSDIIRFNKKLVKYRDVPMHGKRVTLWVVTRRYQCKSCKGTFTPAIPEMAEAHRMTKRCYQYIIKRALTGTNASVAQDVGFDESVTRGVIKSYCEQKAKTYKPVLPRVLGIDELYLNKTFRCVLTNIEQGTIIDILESRQSNVIYNRLAHMEGRENVQIVCQDMWKPYRDVASQLFPKASIVVDRFHIQRMANEAMETLRKSLKKDLTVHHRRQLKGDRKMMLMRKRDLNPMQQMIIETWLDHYPELGLAYQLKEEFFDIWLAQTEPEARMRYQNWLAKIPEHHKKHWKPLITSMTNWEKEIFAYFGPAQRKTNAFTESINRKMRDLNRDSRGMSFEMFRAKTLFTLKHKFSKPKPVKESPFTVGYVTVGSWDLDDEILDDYGVSIDAILQSKIGE